MLGQHFLKTIMKSLLISKTFPGNMSAFNLVLRWIEDPLQAKRNRNAHFLSAFPFVASHLLFFLIGWREAPEISGAPMADSPASGAPWELSERPTPPKMAEKLSPCEVTLEVSHCLSE